VNEPVDPIRARRAQIARVVDLGKRVGYGALLVAIVAFASAAATDFPDWLVTLTIAALAAAIVILPAPMVLGYGIRAAEREDREAGT
jgi:Kef-type K+ transport system membrane component KefB